MAKGRVLVVDAEASVRLAVQKILNADGYEVAQADSKRSALELFGAAPADAVIVDASLPDGDTLDLISQVKGADPLIPCIVLASYESLESRLEEPSSLSSWNLKTGKVRRDTNRVSFESPGAEQRLSAFPCGN